MEFNGYQALASTTAVYPGETVISRLSYVALGLTGEAGEVAQVIKRVLRDDQDNIITDERYESLKAEIGDCLWYLAQICNESQISLDEVAEENIQKLLSRQERGQLHGAGDKR